MTSRLISKSNSSIPTVPDFTKPLSNKVGGSETVETVARKRIPNLNASGQRKKRKFEGQEAEKNTSLLDTSSEKLFEHEKSSSIDKKRGREKDTVQAAPHDKKLRRRYSEGNVKTVTKHFLPMKGAIFMEKIMSGEKKFEGRVCRPTVNRFKVGEHLELVDRQAGWGIVCQITSLDKYTSFEAMLRAKGVLNLLPQLQEKAESLSSDNLVQEGVKIYERFPGAKEAHRLGVMAIGVLFLQKIHQRS